jgi:hypothetical protein
MTDDTNTQPRSPYQFFDPLSDEAYDALKMDILKNGVRRPVEKDEDGNTLDGHNREKIATELGIECPTVTIHTLKTEKEKIEYSIKANILRRNNGPLAWARTLRWAMQERGIERHAHHNRSTATAATFAALAAEFGLKERTARDHLHLLEELEVHPDLMRKVDAGEMPVAAARSEIRKRKSAAKEPPKADTGEEVKDQLDLDKQVDSGAKTITQEQTKETLQESTHENAETATAGAADGSPQDVRDEDSNYSSTDEVKDQPDLKGQEQSGAGSIAPSTSQSEVDTLPPQAPEIEEVLVDTLKPEVPARVDPTQNEGLHTAEEVVVTLTKHLRMYIDVQEHHMFRRFTIEAEPIAANELYIVIKERQDQSQVTPLPDEDQSKALHGNEL